MPVYLHAMIKAKYGRNAEVTELIGEALPILEEAGWKLIGAYQTVVGDLRTILDLWELPEANTVGEVLAKVAQNPDFQRIGAALAEVVEEEELQLMDKTPYSP